jgi:hypothetical protein
VAWCRRAQPSLRCTSSAARALVTPLQRVSVIAASTPVHTSSALAWGSTAILAGLPRISDRGGDKALEGPGSVEVVLLSALGSGAALSVEGATLAPASAAGVSEGTSGVLVVLAVVGAAGAAPVVSGVPLC